MTMTISTILPNICQSSASASKAPAVEGEAMEFQHVSVLLEETIRELQIKPDGIYVDGTLGGAEIGRAHV